MENSPVLDTKFQDTKSLRNCPANRAKMLLKSYIGIKCHYEYVMVIRLLQHSSANSQCVWLGMYCDSPGDYHSLNLTRIQFYSPEVTPLTKLDEIKSQVLCYCNSNAWGWLSCQGGVINITNQSILPNGKKLRGTQEEQQRDENTACGTPTPNTL